MTIAQAQNSLRHYRSKRAKAQENINSCLKKDPEATTQLRFYGQRKYDAEVMIEKRMEAIVYLRSEEYKERMNK